MEVVASLSQGRIAAAHCGLFTHKSVPAIFEPPCTYKYNYTLHGSNTVSCRLVFFLILFIYFQSSNVKVISLFRWLISAEDTVK